MKDNWVTIAPSPAHSSQRPPFTLKLKVAGPKPLALASSVSAKSCRIRIVNPHIRCRIGTRGSADGRLVNVNHVVHGLVALEGVVGAGENAAVITQRGQFFENDLIHERTFPGAGSARHADQQPQRNLHIEVAQIVVTRAEDAQSMFARDAA